MAYKALLIANWEYSDGSKKLTPLRGPRNDLRVMHEALTDSRFGLFESENVKCHSNLEFAEMPGAFLEFLKAADRDDRLLLYFSGHGERNSDETLVLCGVNTDFDLLEAQGFDTSKLRSWIEQHNRAPSTIVVLDCCYAGQMKGPLSEQTLVDSLGTGTMLLASAANKATRDADNEEEPSPFTDALTKILLNPEVKGDESGWLTDDDVYRHLMARDPPLLPKPYRNAQSEGTFALARRESKVIPKRHKLKGYYSPRQTEIIDLRVEAETVTACWESGHQEVLELTALDRHRRTAVRRLSQLADAVIRVPEYAEDQWYQQAVQKAWDCIGVNLFETGVPLSLRDRIRSGLDETGRNLLKLRLTFGSASDSLEPYPWEYLQLDYAPEAKQLGDEYLPLGLRSGLLIERVARASDAPMNHASPTDAASTVGIVNCLQDKFMFAASRVTEDLTKLAGPNVIIDLKGNLARWNSFLDALSVQAPRLLLLFAPVRRSPRGVQVGFIPDDISDKPDEPEWHLGRQMTSQLRAAELFFDAIVFVTFAARPGQDSLRGTYELAQVLADSGIGPVVFVCHAPGFQPHYRDPKRDAFPVLFVDALTSGISLDKAFYYAKNRVTQMGSEAVLRTFGVPGYYVPPPTQRVSIRASPVTLGDHSAEVDSQGVTAKEATRDDE